jgi:hypothetical protein
MLLDNTNLFHQQLRLRQGNLDGGIHLDQTVAGVMVPTGGFDVQRGGFRLSALFFAKFDCSYC